MPNQSSRNPEQKQLDQSTTPDAGLQAENEALKKQLAELQSKSESAAATLEERMKVMEGRLLAMTDQVQATQQTVRTNQEKTEREEALHREYLRKLLADADEQLSKGKHKFLIAMDGNDCGRKRLVGGDDSEGGQARMKYNRYFGINASFQAMSVEPFTQDLDKMAEADRRLIANESPFVFADASAS